MEEYDNKKIYQYFLEKGCTLEEVSSILSKCPELINFDEEMLDKKVTCMFNADKFYGVIICDGDKYIQVLSDKVLAESNDDLNYVGEILMNTFNKPYLQKIMGIEPEDNLELKLYKMRQSKFNSTGYKVK